MSSRYTKTQLHRNFEEIENIGRGGFGQVFKARCKSDKQFYAIKVVCLKEDVQVDREIQALIKLEHKNVVKYCCSWHENHTPDGCEFSSSEASCSSSSDKTHKNLMKILCIQMELCQCTLRNIMASELTDYQVFHFFNQLCHGLQHIHSNGIIHRDLKPENIFITNGHCVKIGDFGLSRPQTQTIQMDSDSGGTSDALTRYVGTKLYTAPEIAKEHYKYDEKVDIYSLGIIYFEMGYGPFFTEMERWKLLEGIRLEEIKMPDHCKKPYNNLIRELLDHNPKRRLTAKKILKKIPPSVENLNQFIEKINPKQVPTKTIGTYLRLFTRLECTDQGKCLEMNMFKGTGRAYRLHKFLEHLNNLLKQYRAHLLIVPLFLHKNRSYFNVSTDVCLLNDNSAEVFAIPSDRRLCFINYLKTPVLSKPHMRRYSIDTIYEGSSSGSYDEIMECNFDEIIHDNYAASLFESLLQKQIALQLNSMILQLSSSAPVIHINHQLLYKRILEYFNLSVTDQQILQESLLYKKINSSMLARRLGQKTKISPETIAEICKIFSGNEESFLQRNEFQESVNMIKIFIHKLRKEDITCPIEIMPLMVPHIYSTGIIYEILFPIQGNLRILSKGSSYTANFYSGAGFSLNISNICLVPEPLNIIPPCILPK